MKLLQINDKEWINPDMIMSIEEDPVDNSFCFIHLSNSYKRFCDRYSAQQLISKICEEFDYGEEIDKTRHEIRVLQSEIDYKKDIIEHTIWRMNHENDGIRKDD